MERNIRLTLAFDGTEYSGWQRQHHAPTIQGILEDSLSRITGHPVTLHGAGRTDAGVHALAMVANFRTPVRIPLPAFREGLNSMLPLDIRVLEAKEVPREFHSRFSACAKTYRYDLCTESILLPHHRYYTAHRPCAFDLASVLEALTIFQGTHDFSSFEGSGSRDPHLSQGRGAVRTLYQADCVSRGEATAAWRFRFTGDGFLRHMVRNLVGTLIEIGRGKLGAGDAAVILEARDRRVAGPTAPACGLFLEQVHYRIIS